MNFLRVVLEGGRTSFRPGEPLVGTAEWKFDRAPQSVEVRLYWGVERDRRIDPQSIAAVKFEHAKPQERRPFRFQLPEGPYSFKGQALALRWGVELVALPRHGAARAEFAMAPGGVPVELYRGSAR